MLTKEQAQSLKKMREFLELDKPLLEKRLDIIETGHSRVVDEMMLSNLRKQARFNIDDTGILCLLGAIDAKLLQIIDILNTEGSKDG